MQPGALARSSAYAVALTGKLVLLVATRAKSSGREVVTVTCIAWLALFAGEVTRAVLALLFGSPLRVTMLPAALLALSVDPVAL